MPETREECLDVLEHSLSIAGETLAACIKVPARWRVHAPISVAVQLCARLLPVEGPKTTLTLDKLHLTVINLGNFSCALMSAILYF